MLHLAFFIFFEFIEVINIFFQVGKCAELFSLCLVSADYKSSILQKFVHNSL
jgi:hypothetical protein